MSRSRRWRASEDGQVAVSLVAVIPALILVGLAFVQCALAGYAAYSAAGAARAAARASYAGTDVARAARAALPESLRDDADVSERGDSAHVVVEAARALPLLPPIEVSASAQLGPADGIPGG